LIINILINKVALLFDLAVNVHKAFVIDVQLELVTDLGDLEVVLADVEVDHKELLQGLLLVHKAVIFEESFLSVYYRMLNLEQILNPIKL
jgi:hypothetical protein